VKLHDHRQGDGGLCVVPGSHKSNFRCPVALKRGDRFSEYIKQVDANAGDVVIMTETTTHGTLPWVQPAYDRRSLVYKFSPGSSSRGR
jgi:ectoine hydroxylase-related dioxygenase (phytanoyl-CoA dioxygenase family)